MSHIYTLSMPEPLIRVGYNSDWKRSSNFRFGHVNHYFHYMGDRVIISFKKIFLVQITGSDKYNALLARVTGIFCTCLK